MVENSLLNLRRCPNCGHFVPVGVALCPDCGATIPAERVAHPPEPDRVLEVGDLLTKSAGFDYVLGVVTPFILSILFTIAETAVWKVADYGFSFWIAPFNITGYGAALLLFLIMRGKYKRFAHGILVTLRVIGILLALGLLILLGLLAYCMMAR